MFGDNILAQLVLALGGAMAVGSILALVRPPAQRRGDADLTRAPIARSVAMIAVGLIAALWAVVTLATT
ncbi:hypothetical protein BH24ACT2_BH24ACT2_17180 [soil metagenome]|jgi:hypothetical protein|nr:hypothetical protein [Acidimicrobiia bacterium]MDQ3461525.1 hypothetical protein [Actinomycetota bacterium]